MDFASANLTAGQLNAVVKKLGGELGVKRFLRGELTVVETHRREFPIWQTVRLGVHKTADEYRRALKAAKYRGGEWGANDFLAKAEFTCATEETDVDLVAVSVADLGFKDGALYSQICGKAHEMGLVQCPVEVGPALLLAHKDQPRGERLIIAMKANADSGGDLDEFDLELGGSGLSLRGYCGPLDRFWDSERRFVFVRRES
jgi:hypothetical protein